MGELAPLSGKIIIESAFVGATMVWGKVGLPFFKMIACALVKSNKCQHSSDVQTKALHAL